MSSKEHPLRRTSSLPNETGTPPAKRNQGPVLMRCTHEPRHTSYWACPNYVRHDIP